MNYANELSNICLKLFDEGRVAGGGTGGHPRAVRRTLETNKIMEVDQSKRSFFLCHCRDTIRQVCLSV